MPISKSYQIFIFLLLIFSGFLVPEFLVGGNNVTKTLSFPDNPIQSYEPIDLTQNLNLPVQNQFADVDLNIPQRLRDNINEYTQVWNPWLTRAGTHVSAVSDDGEFLAVGGGFLIDTTVHIYRWNLDLQQYEKVYEAGAGVIQSDILSIDFGDVDNNGLMDMAVASADGRVYLFEQSHIFDPTTQLDSRFDLVWTSPKLFRATSVQIADLDRDNIQDIIVGSWDKKVHIFEYSSRSGYPFALEHWIDLKEVWTSEELDDKIQAVSVTDLNGNDLPDFVVGTYSGSVYVFENDGAIVDTPTGQVPLPNDNEYRQLWTSFGPFQPIWNPVGNIVADDLDGDGKDEAVILGWGQGAWMFRYDQNSGFQFDQMFKPFESWQIQGVYPLDNWADWMQESGTFNVHLGTFSSSNSTCASNPTEPIMGCIKPFINSASSEAPDNVFSQFISNATHGAQAVWDFGEDEEIASNGNPSPDLYVIMKEGHAVPSEWNISISNDLNTWYQINQSQISRGRFLAGGASNLEVDLDPVFSLNRLSSARYLRMRLLPEESLVREIDAIVAPAPAQPLTLAVSATIQPLPLSYDEANSNTQEKKIIFGGTDGRLIAFSFDQQNTITYRDQYAIANLVTFDAGFWDVNLQSTTQQWDSFTDDRFNLDETIWSIYGTPKDTFVPTWRKESGLAENVLTDVNVMSTEVPNFYPTYPLTVGFNTTISAPNGYIASISQSNSIGKFPFSLLNSYFGGKFASSSEKYSLTFTYGDFYSDIPGNELITLPYVAQAPKIGQVPTDIYGNGPYMYFESVYYYQYPYPIGPTTEPGLVVDQGNTLFNYLHSGETFPSMTAGDIDGDGDTDLIASNGRIMLYENVGNPNSPSFIANEEYFEGLNQLTSKDLIYQPQLWDYDRDGDLDLLYSLGMNSEGKQKYGLRFYANTGTQENPVWEDKSEIVRNPSLEGNMVENKMTFGTVKMEESSDASGNFLWVYQKNSSKLIELRGEVGTQSSFIVGTNPTVKMLSVNKLTAPDKINFGYTITDTWSNGNQFDEWTGAMSVGMLDGDNHNEVIVADYDNNLYVFEHLSNNTYKRAFKSPDLNHTEATDKSPYRFQDFEGISGNFSKIVYEHGSLLATGFDGDNDGLQEFALVAGLSIYIFEATRFNDKYSLIYVDYLGDKLAPDGTTLNTKFNEISAISVIQDYNGLGPMIALSGGSYLFLLRNDPTLGWLETYQSLEGTESYSPLFNNMNAITISSLLFSDLNQDGTTELWIAGNNFTSSSPFLWAIESDILTYNVVYRFSESFLRMSTINVLTFSEDIDYNGKFELLIGHDLGLDIIEFDVGSGFQPRLIQSISADPTYNTNPNQILLGKNLSPFIVKSRGNDIYQLSNGKYLMVVGREYNQSNILGRDSLLATSELIGDLAFALVDSPTDVSQTLTKVSTSGFDLAQSAASFEVSGTNYTVRYETAPDITEFCIGGCSGGIPNGFAIVWTTVAHQTGTNNVFYFNSLQLFDLSGNKIGSTVHNLLSTGSVSYPSVVVNPSDNTELLIFTQENTGMILYRYQINLFGPTFTVSLNQNQLGFQDYFVFSVDAVSLSSASTEDVLGVAFSGYFVNSTNRISKINYATMNSSLQVTGVFQTTDSPNQDFKPKMITGSRPGELVLVYESRIQGFLPFAGITYSKDGGRSWEEPFRLDTLAPNVKETGNGVFETLSGVRLNERISYGPSLTRTLNGGILYISNERMTIPQFSDMDFVNSSVVSRFLTHDWMTSYLVLGNISSTSFVQYFGISNVEKIATGDTDLDGRKEIFISVGKTAILLEIDRVSGAGTEFVQKWISPKYSAQISDVAIFDGNGNNWAELLVSVKGGDVFAYELADTSQIPVDDFFLTELNKALSINATIAGNPPYSVEATSLLVAETQNGLEISITNGLSSATRGAFTWSVENDNIVRDVIMNGATIGFQFNDSRGKSFVLVSDREIRVYDEDWTLQFTGSFSPSHVLHHSLKFDVNSDGLDDLLLVESERLFAIDPFTGTVIFERSRTGAQLFDLNRFEIGNESFIAVVDSDLSTYRRIEIFNSTGYSLSNYSIPVGTTFNSTIGLSDFNLDGILDVAVLDFENDGSSQLITYSLDSDDIVSNPTIISNLTIPLANMGVRAPIRLFTLDTNEDGKKEVILTVAETSSISEPNMISPSKGTSALFAIDVSDPSVLWERDFNAPINNVEFKDGILYAYVKDYGVQGLTISGSDLFWAPSKNPAVAEIHQDQIIVVERNADTSIYNFTGKLANAKLVISEGLNLIKSSTFRLYQVPSRITAYSYLVDVTDNGVQDIVTGFTNGTLALRNHEVGEYWRIRTQSFDSMVATEIRFDENKLGMAIYLSSGRLLIFNRLAQTPTMNVSTPEGLTFTNLKTYSVDGRQNLILWSENDISIFDPSTGLYIWNTTRSETLTKLDVGAFDINYPNVISHIIAVSEQEGVELIPLPTTLVPGGLFQPPSEGIWLDFSVTTGSNGLAQVLLLSSKGELRRMNWETDGSISQYSQQTSSNAQNFVVNGDQILISAERSLLRYVDTGSGFNEISTISHDYIGQSEIQMVDFDNDGQLEILASFGNMVISFFQNGTISSIHSFSSGIKELKVWIPDASGNPAIFAILTNGDIEFSDPFNREFNDYIAPISVSEFQEDPQPDLTVLLPEPTWTEYISQQELEQNYSDDPNLFFLGFALFGLGLATFIVLFRRKRA
ncbi:MAG: VCBS repeat-containing protein [Methanobacteriota archaeon]|nr:MAG: VCBS repeat-containing protein [Euryarchaeota archaeon]